MAGVLLVGAIISLYFVTGPEVRLGLLTMWTVLFAFSVSVLSTASRSELFAATAASDNLPISCMTSLTSNQVRCGAGGLCEWQSSKPRPATVVENPHGLRSRRQTCRISVELMGFRNVLFERHFESLESGSVLCKDRITS